MPNVGTTLKRLRNERGWTLAETARRLSLAVPPLKISNTSQIHRRESGDIEMKISELPSWASIFEIPLEKLRQMIDADSTKAAHFGRSIHDPRGIPIINRAPAGLAADFYEYGADSRQGSDYLERGSINDDLAFAVIVTGDSMNPTLVDGDHLVFTPVTIPQPRASLKKGDVVFARFTPESGRSGCTIARYQPTDDGAVVLTKDNPQYQPILCRREDLEQLAVCIERRTRRI